MAQRGFLSRIFSRVRELFTREPEQEEPVAPPLPGETAESPGPIDLNDEFRRIWREQDVDRKYSYRRMLNAFLDFENGLNIVDEDDMLPDIEPYIKYMVKGESRYLRNDPRNPFWRHMGVDPGDFDWDSWRTAMGYKARRR